MAIRDKVRADLGNVTILSVDTSADYAFARVFVEIQGDETERQRALAELERAGGFLRTEIASRVKLRQTPQLRFSLDRGRDNANRVEELLNQINSGNKE